MAEHIETDSIFREIVSKFESAGITDSVLIAEHVAFFALCRYGGTWKSLISEVLNTAQEMSEDSYVSNLQGMLPKQLFKPNAWQTSSISGTDPRSIEPNAPTGMHAGQLAKLILLFNTLFENIPDLGEWFDQIALPSLFKTMQGGGRYPTPRHLERFMAHLVQVNEKDSIADFACGTGGLLVADGQVTRATGVEISPNMARLALTNLILHGQEQRDLYLGNTFALTTQDSKFRDAEFDVILMNPPFGISIEPALIDATFAPGEPGKNLFSGRSETHFANLAYKKLKPSGRMAIMAPSGVLFSNNSGERILRDILLENNALKAVISLPKDATQPYSALPTHVLVAQKPLKEPTKFDDIWFYGARYDGFTSGRNRQPDSNHNDLPVIAAAVSNRISRSTRAHDQSNGVQVRPLKLEKKVVGYEFWGSQDSVFHIQRQTSYRDPNDISFLIKGNPASVENITYVTGNKVFRNGEKSEEVFLDLPYEIKIDSYLYFKFSDETLQGIEIRCASDGLEFMRKKASSDYVKLSRPAETDSLVFIVDSKGKLISTAVHIDNKYLTRRNAPYSLELVGNDEPRFARMLIFPKQLSTIPLVDAKGKKVFLFSIDDGWGVYLESEKRFVLGQVESCFESDQQHSGALFDLQGNLIGVAVPAEFILKQEARDLQPATYLPREKIKHEERHPAQILADIKTNQNELASHLDRLMGIAELKSVATAELPPRVAITDPPNGLQGAQAVIWTAIQNNIEQNSLWSTPIPFQAGDIAKSVEKGLPIADIQRTLELFERMGLIIKVSYDGAPFYRLLTEADAEKGEME